MPARARTRTRRGRREREYIVEPGAGASPDQMDKFLDGMGWAKDREGYISSGITGKKIGLKVIRKMEQGDKK